MHIYTTNIAANGMLGRGRDQESLRSMSDMGFFTSNKIMLRFAATPRYVKPRVEKWRFGNPEP
jgi:hypothetical protein